MKTYNEWQHESTINENPEVLMEKMTELTHLMDDTLRNFQGERPEGFLNLIGTVNNLKRALVDLQNGTESPSFMTSEQKAPNVATEKCDYKEKKSKGTRMVTDKEVSKDYGGHIKKLGTVGPFKILKK